MNDRPAARAPDAEALLARFNGASEAAIAALDRGDRDALVQALDVRDVLQLEIERVAREYRAPLEELAGVAQALQHRLEQSAMQVRDGLLNEIATLENSASIAARYVSAASPDESRLDVIL